MRFVLYCEPTKHTAQGSSTILKSRDGRLFIGKKSNSLATQAKKELMWLLAPYRPDKMMTGAIRLNIDLYFSWRKSESKTNRQKGIMPVIVKPDLDNWNKAFCDCLTRIGFWKDDSQIYDLHLRKFYADSPRIEVEIEENPTDL